MNGVSINLVSWGHFPLVRYACGPAVVCFYVPYGTKWSVRLLPNPKAGHMRPGARTRVASQGSCIICCLSFGPGNCMARALGSRDTPVPVRGSRAPSRPGKSQQNQLKRAFCDAFFCSKRIVAALYGEKCLNSSCVLFSTWTLCCQKFRQR